MLPARERAELLLMEAEACNPGPWANHSRVAARCAERIARRCAHLDAEKAYVLGLLHDIGRRFGVRHLGHVSDGYTYMMSLGFDEVARVCLTHSFHNATVEEYIGRLDTTQEELSLITEKLRAIVMDEYDRLIQLCDGLAGSEGPMALEARMADVRRRYGRYPQGKWDINLRLKAYFDELCGGDVDEIVREGAPAR